MSPAHDLKALAATKRLLRRRIGHRREQTVAAATAAAQPLRWLDQALALWRRASPLLKYAAVPLGLWLTRSRQPRAGLLGGLLRWGPLVAGVVRGVIRSSRAAR